MRGGVAGRIGGVILRGSGLLLLLALSLSALTGPARTAAQPGRAAASPRKVFLPRTPALERLIDAGQVGVLETYGEGIGSRLLVSASSDALAAAGIAPATARQVRDQILLRRRAIDPSGRSSPRLPRRPHVAIVQFHGPVKRSWVERLTLASGRTPLAYVPHNAYLVWLDDGERLASHAREIPLQWTEELLPSDRLSPDLPDSGDPVTVSIQVARAGRHDDVIADVLSRAEGIVSRPESFGALTHVRATIAADALASIASHPEVVWIEPYETPILHDERSALISAGLVTGNNPVKPGYLSWLAAKGLDDLSDIIVDVVDSGIDSGGTDVVHPGLKGRVTYAFDWTSEGTLQDCVGHGTHVAGTIAGAAAPGAALQDKAGYLSGLGVVPSLRVGSSRIFRCNSAFDPVISFTDLVASAYAQGARIGNNSWGTRGPQYNTVCAEYDALVRDANRDPRDGDQPFLPIFSAGNLGPVPRTVGWPATAKNVIAVGASEGVRIEGTDGCGTEDIQADNANHMLTGSSRGPAADGRRKPDLLAPGSHIHSLASTAADYSGRAVCDPFYPPGQQVLSRSTGTSHSAPHVTAGAAIAMSIFRKINGVDPSPAMLKAMLLNHARDLAEAPTNVGPRPNNDQGWGRLDFGSLVDEPSHAFSDQETVFTTTGQEAVFAPVAAANATRRVIVTLVWTDAPGAPGASAWVNDLDLQVVAGGATYLGNAIVNGVSVAGGEADERNNIEMVILPPGQTQFSVRVLAANIAGDGLPSLPGETDQDFALYISNARMAGERGIVALSPPFASCGAPLTVHVTDAALAGAGTMTATVDSGSDRETVRLQENPPLTGVFAGPLDVSEAAVPAVHENGALQTADGARVAASYTRAAPDGQLLTRTASVTAFCSPLAIEDLRVARSGQREATVTWRTNRPADSTLLFGQGNDRLQIVTDPKQVTEHVVPLSLLPQCTFHTAAARSTDASGRTAESVTPLRFSTGPQGRRVVFRDDMEELATRWTHAPARPGAADNWELGFPAADPRGAFSGARAWGTRLNGLYDVGSDAVLVSPLIDLRDAVRSGLTFRHNYDIAGGATPSSENDGGWLEVSADDGTTWARIEPPAGYPDRVDVENPYLSPDERVYAGAPGAWVGETFDLSSYDGNIIRIRFHIWQDANEPTPRGSGWSIDDVEVTAESTCHAGRLQLDAQEYGCSSRVAVELFDTSLALSTTAIDTATVIASTPGGTLPVTLTETGLTTAAFRGTFQLGPSGGAGALPASQGDPLTVRYDDLDSGGGVQAVITVSGAVVDCEAPPPPTGVAVRGADDGSLVIAWDPVQAPDIAGYRVHYDTDGPGPAYLGLGALQGSSPVRLESASTAIALAALDQCAPHFITVTAFDRFANESGFSQEHLAIPARDTPCSLGRISAPSSAAGCNETVALGVADSNADPNPTTPGSVVLTASATSPGSTPVMVSLIETTPASGLFAGALALSNTSSPGALIVTDDDQVTLVYGDADDGTGSARSVTRLFNVADCAPPIITGVTGIGRGSDRARILWTTDEPADSRVDYGADPSLGLTKTDPGLVLQHEVTLHGLSPCSSVYFAVSSSDARGNIAREGQAGLPFHFGTFREVPLLFEDFESGAAGWTHASMTPLPDEWELGAPAGDNVNAPSSAFSGTAVWGTDLDGPYERGHDLVLVSPAIDIPIVEASTLTFWHWYDISTVGAPSGFDDGGFVEISVNGGASWSLIEPFGGYPDVIGPNPYIGFGAGVYAGRTGGWTQARFPLDGLGGRTIHLRFHLLQDTPDPTHVPGFGWYIDDLAVTVSRPCHDATIALDRSAYVCNDSIAIRIEDSDLDQDPLLPDQTASSLTSDAEPAGEVVTLTETGPSTGLFDGAIALSAVDAPGVLAAAEGDEIVARHDDADDGTGNPRTRTAHAAVVECAAPVIENVRVVRITPESFHVAWTTDELSDSRVLYGTNPSLPLQIVDETPVREHEMTVEGLAPCALHHFTVASRDASGNIARDDASAGIRSLRTSGALAVLDEDFSGSAPGWRTRGQGDLWRIAAGRASHAPGAAYPRPAGAAPNSDFVLESPRFNIARLTEPILTLTHSFDFPLTGGGGDGGRIEGWNGTAWIPLAPVSGYPGAIDPEASPAGIPLPGFSGPSSGTLTSTFDLTPLLHADSGAARVRFRVFVESGVGPTGAGWYIESATVSGALTCREGRLVFDRDDATCADQAVSLMLHDDDLDTSPSTSESIVVTVDSTGGPAPLAVTLLERGPGTGRFDGVVPISATGVPGTLRAAAGDVVTARYDDADDGTGTPRLVSASLPVVPCAGPVLRGIATAADETGRIRVRWTSDIPATSEVTLTPTAGGADIVATSLRPVTSHDVTLPVGAACGSWRVGLASEDQHGLRSTAGGPASDLIAESVEERTHFFDNMEGANPGWTSTGQEDSWERGIPVVGPAFAFSGQRVFGTDLTEDYHPGTNATLTTPPIDLRTATSPRLTFWHWYDIFSSEPPNSFDDGAWVEVLPDGTGTPIYVAPIDGYSDIIDGETGHTLVEGTPVFGGFSNTWEKVTFDLTPYAGKVVLVRFRIWNDLVELLVNGITGAGWSLDDVQVTSSRFCHPSPALTSVDRQTVRQGETVAGVTIDGSGFRAGLRIAAGTGMTGGGIQVISPTQIRFDLSVDPKAPLGRRDLVVVNADGQASTLAGAIEVRFATARADIDGSGRIDGGDLAILAIAFGATEASPHYDSAADLDNDGVIDGMDLALLASNFGLSLH